MVQPTKPKAMKEITIEDVRNQTDANAYVDRAIEMLKPEIVSGRINVAAYNGVLSLLRYAKESHAASLNRQGCRWVKASERNPDKEGLYFVKMADGEKDVNRYAEFYTGDGIEWLDETVLYWLDESIEPCATSSENYWNVSLVYTKTENHTGYINQTTMLRVLITSANSEDEALGKAVKYFDEETKGFTLSNKVILKSQSPSPTGDRDCEELKERLIAFGKENNEQFKRISELERGLELMIDQFNPDACDEKEVLDNPTQYEYGDVGRARIIVGIYKAIHNLAKQLLNL